MDDERKQLPVYVVRDELLAQLRANPIVVLVGETGSGKTTQVPRLLLAGGLAQGGAIACTQPRRVAAITIAQRVAAEMGTPVGQTVRSYPQLDIRAHIYIWEHIVELITIIKEAINLAEIALRVGLRMK